MSKAKTVKTSTSLKFLAVLVVVLIFLCGKSYAQFVALDPVSVTGFTQETDIAPGENFRVIVEVNLKKGWSIYGLKQYDQTANLLKPTIIDDKNLSAFLPLTPWYESKLTIKKIDVLELALPVHYEKARFYRNFKFSNASGVEAFSQKIQISYQACDDKICLPPATKHLSVDFLIADRAPLAHRQQLDKSIDDLPVAFAKSSYDRSWGAFLGLAFVTGLLALLTPCVLPIIPLTLNHFLITSQNKAVKRRRLVFSFLGGLIIVYSLTGLLIAVVFGASSVLTLASNLWVNLFSGFLFLVFGLSILGLVKLPSNFKLTNRVNKLANSQTGAASGFLIGVAFTLSSFTCNLPLVGALLVVAANGGVFYPLVGMAVYSLAFGLPFLLLAFFPKVVDIFKFKSGHWQMDLRLLIGVLEIMVALKFFANFDLVLQLNILTRDVLLIIYAFLCAAAAVYVLKRFIKDNVFKTTTTRLFVSCLLVFYLLSGSFFSYGVGNRSLGGVIDAFLPPPLNGAHLAKIGKISKEDLTKLNWQEDYKKALKLAQQTGKLVFIDFTGYTCVNCRWMEQNIFADAKVYQKLKNDFVLVSLYTDAGKNYQQNQDYQIKRFNTVALPFYAILNSEDKILATSVGITRLPKEFLAFLNLGG